MGPVALAGLRGLSGRATPGHSLAPTGRVRSTSRVRPTPRAPHGCPVALDPYPAVTYADAVTALRAIGAVGTLAAAVVAGQREVQQDAVDIVGEQPCGLGQISRRAHFDGPAALVQHARHAQRACRIVLDHEQGQTQAARALLLGEQGLAGHGL